MCGRYSVSVSLPNAAEELGAELTVSEAPRRHNVAPTDPAPIAIEGASGRRIGLGRFGLVPRDGDPPRVVGARFINLRAEGVASQRKFAEILARRRCLVLADGFFEWEKLGAKKKQPWWIHGRERRLLTFAGVWDVWRGEEGELVSFAILTTRPDEVVAPLHDRMPVIVPPAARADWLAPAAHEGAALLAALRGTAGVPLEAYRVSDRVGRVQNDDPALLAPVDDVRRR